MKISLSNPKGFADIKVNPVDGLVTVVELPGEDGKTEITDDGGYPLNLSGLLAGADLTDLADMAVRRAAPSVRQVMREAVREALQEIVDEANAGIEANATAPEAAA